MSTAVLCNLTVLLSPFFLGRFERDLGKLIAKDVKSLGEFGEDCLAGIEIQLEVNLFGFDLLWIQRLIEIAVDLDE
jgi:hypothetical protein